VRVIGRDIVHKFKFNTVAKQDEAPRIFLLRRDERLRKINTEVVDEKKQAEGRLAIPSNKELFVKNQEYSGYSTANKAHERRLNQRNFDNKRMDQLTSYM